MTGEAGYSGTPLPKKLGLKDGQAVAFCALPESQGDLLTARAYAFVEEVAEFDRKSRAYVPMEQLKKENYSAWQRMAGGNYGSNVDLTKFRDTVVQGLENVIEQNRGKRAAVFCHGGVINVWATHCLGLEPKLFTDVRYCSINRSMCASTGQRNLQSLNETQHLVADSLV